jgi:hypothetical protein
MGRVVKLSISLPAELAEELRKQAGAGQVSSFIEHAVARRLENINLRRILDEMDDEFGSVPDDMIVAARRQFEDLERRAQAT